MVERDEKINQSMERDRDRERKGRKRDRERKGRQRDREREMGEKETEREKGNKETEREGEKHKDSNNVSSQHISKKRITVTCSKA